MATTRSTSSARSTSPTDPADAPVSSPNLLTIIDGWVRDPAIRAFALTIIAMVLLGLALIVGLASGAIAAFITAVLPNVTSRVIAGAVGATATGGGIWLSRRQRIRRRATITPEPPAASS